MRLDIKERSQWVSDVGEFLDQFHQDSRSTPGWPDQEIVNLRARLIKEEYSELTDAWMRRDLPETVDGILDLIYVLIGTLPALGVEADPIWDAIHAANMAKDRGDKDAKGKVQKPPDWTGPNIRHYLLDQGWLSQNGRKGDMDKNEKRILLALEVAIRYGAIDGSHHKMWVIDQMVRALTGTGYSVFIDDWFADGEGCADWDEGIAP